MSVISKTVIAEVLSRATNIREVSRKAYINVMNRISELTYDWYGSYPYDVDSLLSKLASETTNKHTLKLRYSTLVVFLKQMTVAERNKYFSANEGDVYEKVLEVVKKIGDEVQESYVLQKMTSNEKRNWEQWPVVERMWTKKMTRPSIPKHFDSKLLHSVQEYALVGLYTVIPPVRNDYRTVRVTEADNTNFIKFDTSKHTATIVLNEYKTSKKYGPINLTISSNDSRNHKVLYEALKDLTTARKKIGDSYLFAPQRGGSEPLTGPNYSQLLTSIYQRHLGKPLGSQMIRKIYLSYVQKDEPTLVEKRNTAAAMGHSTGMQALYRRLPDDPKSKSKK